MSVSVCKTVDAKVRLQCSCSCNVFVRSLFSLMSLISSDDI